MIDPYDAIESWITKQVRILKNEEYDGRYKYKFEIELLEAGFRPRIANNYDRRFDADTAFSLFKQKILPEVANQYDKRFKGYEISALSEQKISPETANKYDERFKGNEVFYLCKQKISPEVANKYNKIFSAESIDTCVGENISPETANKYDKRFRGWAEFLIRKHILPEVANKYDKRFSKLALTVLCDYNVPPEFANELYKKFHKKLDYFYIERLHKAGISMENLGKLNNETREKILENMESYFGECSFINTGSTAIILLDKKKKEVLKFSGHKKRYRLSLDHTFLPFWIDTNKKFYNKKEFELLSLLNDTKNVIKLKQERFWDYIGGGELELEYINGDSLENILKKQKILPSEKILKYSADILNGMIEMRMCVDKKQEKGFSWAKGRMLMPVKRIYHHRDIRPANVLIDEENDRAVICDLGIATIERHALAKDNRRYGSPSREEANDLISLGQVIYKMATGDNLFADSAEMEECNPERIRARRDEAYPNPYLFDKYLSKIDSNVNDEKVKNVIKECLASKNYDYGKMQKMFERLK